MYHPWLVLNECRQFEQCESCQNTIRSVETGPPVQSDLQAPCFQSIGEDQAEDGRDKEDTLDLPSADVEASIQWYLELSWDDNPSIRSSNSNLIGIIWLYLMLTDGLVEINQVLYSLPDDPCTGLAEEETCWQALPFMAGHFLKLLHSLPNWLTVAQSRCPVLL